MTTRHLSLSVLVLALLAGIVFCETTKYTELQSIASKIAAMAATQPTSYDPTMQNDPALASLTTEELKRLKSLDMKLNGVAIHLTSLAKLLQKNPLRKMRDGRTVIDHIRDIYGKLKQLEPQLRVFGDRLPAGMNLDELKLLEKQLKAVLEDEEQAGKAVIASKELQKKVEAKKKKKAIPRGVYGAQCGPGPCCDSVRFRFLAAGTGCTASECVSASQCLGNSEQCPAGESLPDGTVCSKGKCLAGVCINEGKLLAATVAENASKCVEGTCCDIEKGALKAKGTPCDVPEELCVEPAALCSGESELCEVVDKPDDTLCLVGDKSGVCKKGVCEESGEDDVDTISKEDKQSSAEKRQLLAKRRAELKRLKEQKKQRELKHLVQRFGVLLWMNNKIDTLDADMKVAQYLDGVSGTPTVQQIFAHHRVPTESNKLWSNYFSTNVDDSLASRGVPVTNLISTNTTNTNSTNVLQSGTGASTAVTSSVGIVLFCVALVLIVAYFFIGGKKKNDPKVIY